MVYDSRLGHLLQGCCWTEEKCARRDTRVEQNRAAIGGRATDRASLGCDVSIPEKGPLPEHISTRRRLVDLDQR